MRLTRLDIASLPGLDGSFSLEPAPGVNVVLGPNTSGKSSVARAVRSLLWPDSAPDAGRLLLTAAIADADGPLTVSRQADGPVVWTRDGRQVPPPPLPTDHLRDRYELGLLDLAERGADDRERAFAAEIRRQMTGGFDLDLTGDRLFPHTTGQATRRLNEWRQANAECARHELRQRELHERERRLDSWRAEGAEAAAQGRAAEALRAALAVADARRELAAAQARADAFPAGLAAFHVDDPQTLRALRQRLDQAESDLAAGRRRLDDTRGRLSALSPSRRGETVLPAAVETLVEAWRHAEVAREAAAAALAGVGGQYEAAAAALAPADARDWSGGPDREALGKLARLFVDAEEARAHLRAADTLLSERLLAGGNGAATEASAAAMATLERWLATAVARPWWPLACAAAGAALVAMPAAAPPAGQMISVLPRLIGIALLSVGGVVAARDWLARRRCARLAAAARRDLAAAGLADAERAVAAADRAAAAAARDRWLQDAARHGLVDAWRDRLQGERDRSAARLGALEAEAAALKQHFGLGAELSGRGVLHDADAAARLRESAGAVARASAELEKRAANESERALRVRDVLVRAGEPEPADPAAAAATVRDWQRRLDEAAALSRSAAQLQEQLDEADRRRTAAAADLARVRARLALAPDGSGDDQADALAGRYPDWREAAETRETARAALAARIGAAEPALLALPREELAARLAAAEDAPARATELLQRITALETELAAARAGRGLEQALSERERARDRLFDERSTARRAALADWLLSDLREQNAATARPAVLDTAAELLHQFTRGRHRLELLGATGAEAEFAAIDEQTGRRQSLDELSDGTRAQLLLAVRLSFIMEMEDRGRPLPLFLDEALTTTDGERFAAVSGALGELARSQDRQIFYLTSQPDDAGAWRAALAARGLSGPHVIDLAAARRLAGAATEAQLAPAAPPPLPGPAPGPDGLAAWRRDRGVPPFDPRRDAAAQHVDWLLLDDARLLHRLAVAGAEHVGTLLALAEDLVDGQVIDAPTALRLRDRARAMTAFITQWRIGRGRKVTPADIDASGAVSTAMRGPVLDLVEQLGGDARALAGRWREVKRLQERVAENLLEYLRSTGALDDREVLDETAVLARVLGDLGRRAQGADGPGPDPAELRACVSRWWRAAAAATAVDA